MKRLAMGAIVLSGACNYIIGLTQEPALSDAAVVDSPVGDGGGGDSMPVGDAGPTLLLNARVRHLALDDASIFYTEDIDSVVGRVQKDGTGNVALANGQNATQFFPEQVAVDDTNVFWTSSNGIHECAKAGCSNTPIDLIDDNADASTQYNPGAIGLDTSNVYFVDYDGSGGTAGIRSVPKGAPRGTVTTLAGAAALCPSINHGHVYLPYMYFVCDDGRVGRLQLMTKVVEFLSASGAPMNPDEFVSDGTNIYYGEFVVSASIYQMPIQPSATSMPIALSQPYVNGMAIDGTFLYWALIGAGMDNGTGSIVACALSGCSTTVQTLASFVDVPTDVEVDQTSVYYAAWGNGSTPHTGIWVMPKPP